MAKIEGKFSIVSYPVAQGFIVIRDLHAVECGVPGNPEIEEMVRWGCHIGNREINCSRVENHEGLEIFVPGPVVLGKGRFHARQAPAGIMKIDGDMHRWASLRPPYISPKRLVSDMQVSSNFIPRSTMRIVIVTFFTHRAALKSTPSPVVR